MSLGMVAKIRGPSASVHGHDACLSRKLRSQLIVVATRKDVIS